MKAVFLSIALFLLSNTYANSITVFANYTCNIKFSEILKDGRTISYQMSNERSGELISTSLYPVGASSDFEFKLSDGSTLEFSLYASAWNSTTDFATRQSIRIISDEGTVAMRLGETITNDINTPQESLSFLDGDSIILKPVMFFEYPKVLIKEFDCQLEAFNYKLID